MSAHPLGSPGLAADVGIVASAGWLAARGLYIPPEQAWHATIVLSAASSFASQLTLTIKNEEWSAVLVHDGRRSEILARETPEIVGHDEHDLLPIMPSLKEVAKLVRAIEEQFGLRLQRATATIDTSIAGAEPIIRAWIGSL